MPHQNNFEYHNNRKLSLVQFSQHNGGIIKLFCWHNNSLSVITYKIHILRQIVSIKMPTFELDLMVYDIYK